MSSPGRAPPTKARYGPGLILELLKYAAAELPTEGANSIWLSQLEEADDRQFKWLMDAGLGPLLYRVMRDRMDQVPPVRRDALLSADLTAQVRHGNLIDTASEIADICQGLGTEVTLLKGISISDQHYPTPHLRPMGDIDILVAEHAYESVESAILRRGYSRDSHHRPRAGQHHGAPLLHPGRRVWIEVHIALFPKDAPLRPDGVFSLSNLAAQSVVSTFRGKPVDRLTDELQLVYIAYSWIRDLSRYKIHPSFVIPLLDAVYLLRASRRTLDWDRLVGWLEDDMASASLYLMLAYLSRCGLNPCPPRILSRLASSQNIVGVFELGIIYAMLDRYLVGRKPFTRLFSDWNAMILWNTLLGPGSHTTKLLSAPWNLVFPPPFPDRYSVRFQVGRIARKLSSTR